MISSPRVVNIRLPNRTAEECCKPPRDERPPIREVCSVVINIRRLKSISCEHPPQKFLDQVFLAETHVG